MSIPVVSADWLALRAAADDAARSPALAARLAGLLGAGRLVVHDLGSGDGAMVRWLAPRLGGPQTWMLHDADAGILARADLHSTADGAGRPITATARIGTLADLPRDAFAGADAVTASALLDVLTLSEVERVVAACVAASVPALFSLTVTGSVRLQPADAADRVFEAAFDDHQRRPARGRATSEPLLGPDAVPVVAALFAAAGWNVIVEPSPWLLAADDAALIGEWLDGWIDAAVEQQPELAEAAAQVRLRRRAQAAAGLLNVTVSHEDLLAWPG